MKAPSMALLRAFAPLLRPSETLPWTAAQSHLAAQRASFSTTPTHQAGNKQVRHKDLRITKIRYHLKHPLTPRPLRFSRTRALRHWTIHRAWMRYQDKLRDDQERELERQYNSMAHACETLRLIDSQGLTAEERLRLAEPRKEGEEKDEGRLFRTALMKNGIWGGVPIEYARIQTETPSRDGWNHDWKR